MFRYLYSTFTLILLFLSVSLHAEDAPSSFLQPQKFEIGISMSIPPWVIKENDSGIELDILRASLDPKKYDIQPVYVPFERAYKLFGDGQLDAVMNAKANVVKDGYLSKPVVTFHNYAISLSSKNYAKNIPMAFLHGKNVVGFQKSSQLLGAEYAQMARLNRNYQEVPRQDLQINLLFIREIDFIVMDKSIFGYHWYQAIQNKTNKRIIIDRLKQKVTFHPLFEPSPYPFLFKEQHVRDDFDRGLDKIRSDGRYQQIMDRYDHLSDLYNQ